MQQWMRERKWLLGALALTFLVSFAPMFESWLFVGSDWQGVMQAYGDEILYDAHLHEIAVDGNFWNGSPYFLEHSKGPPLVIFGGTWLAAIPLWLGVPFTPAIFLDYAVWSLIFVLLVYWLMRELTAARWLAAGTALFAYVQYSGTLFRISSRQQVTPFYILFYIAIARLLKKPDDRRNILFLGIVTGLTFYVFSYLWQVAVITLGLLALYAFVRKDRMLLRGTLLSSLLGGIIGLPLVLYTLWLSSTPYFWESIARFGLVNSHLPMAEIVYSGGWIWLVLALLAALYAKARPLLSAEFNLAFLFLAVTGLGLWIMQGSNLITGKLLETGEHIKVFIVTWLVVATALAGIFLWRHRGAFAAPVRFLVAGVFLLLVWANIHFAITHQKAFLFAIDVPLWKEQQSYAAPLRWLDAREERPAVIWGAPRDYSTAHVPVLSKHYVLYAPAGMLHLVSSEELQERYLVSRYFDNPTADDLEKDLWAFVGRGDAFHHAKTIERGIKICRILFFWDARKDCGTPPTSAELLGEELFTGMEQKFRTDIKPNIKDYLKKYQVSYILKDLARDPQYRPEKLGATRVYGDGNFEIYQMP